MNINYKSFALGALLVIVFWLAWNLAQPDDDQLHNQMSNETALQHNDKHLDLKYQCPMHPGVIKDEEGSCPICGMNLVALEKEKPVAKKEKKLLYWVAPMDPNYRRDEPGKSPMGMDLVPVYDDGADEDGSEKGPQVKISAAVENNLGVRTALVEAGDLWRKIDTVGYVDLDESKVSHIHLRVDGWIEKLAVNVEGERVSKGQRLFDLYSPKLVNAMEEYVQAISSNNSRLISASKEKLASLGIDKRQIDNLQKNRKVPQTITVYAPQDGIVSELMVREGMYMMPANKIMTLADLSSVWVLAEVFESQIDWVKLGQSAEVTLSYVPGRTWQGSVDYVYPSLDAKNRTLKVRLKFENTDEVLKPNMYANVLIFGGAKQNIISVPREALIRSGGNERLIIAKGEGRYAQREVVSGMESGDWVEIKSGVSAGEKVVTSSQFLIDSEASMKASLLRMSSNDSANEETNKEGNETPVTQQTVQPATQESSVVKQSVTPESSVSAKGIISSLMIDHGMITLQHEAITSLGWPAMTMDFITLEGVSLKGFSVGDKVEFELKKQGDKYLVSAISRQGVKQ